MNYGMPGAAGPPNGAASGSSQQQQPGGAAGGYPGATAAGPGPQQQQQQHMQITMQQKLHLHHNQQMQHFSHSLHSGQISQTQYSNLVANHNMKMQQLWAQHGSQPRYPPQSEAWRGMQQQQAQMQKEPQNALERKKYAAYMEMQKRNAAAAAAAGHHQMMMARQQQAGYPQGAGPPPPGMMAGRMAMHQAQMMYQGGPPSVLAGAASATPMPPQSIQHGGPPSVQSNINASPQLMHNLQPSTPRYPEHGPPSIPAPGSVPQPSSVPQDDPQTIEYMKLLREMKSEYLERIKAIDERCKMEKVPKPKGIQQILEILEERRRVPIATLEKVRPSLVILVSRDCLTFPLMDEIRRQLFDDKEQRDKLMAQTQKRMETANEEPSTSTAFLSSAAIASNSSDDEDGGAAENEGQNFVRKLSDNWKSFRHRRIRVPKFVKELLAEHYEKVNHRKRKNEETEEETQNEDTLETKRAKKAEEAEVEEEMEVEEICDPKYQIPCLFDNRKPWNMPKMAQTELESLKGWSIDELCLPACSNTPFVVVCIKSSLFLCSPLRIAIPRGYPLEPAAVQFDRSFPQSTLLGTQLQKIFEKWIGIRPAARSITDYAEAFNSACSEMKMYRQAGPLLNGVSAPIVAPEYDAVVVSANKTSKIAQKGMVA